MSEPARPYTIGALARAAGVGVETVRFYQRRGLLPEPERPAGGIRRYGEAELARLRFIRRAQRLGFSLREVAELLQLDDGTHCDQARALAARKLADVQTRLEDLSRIAQVLAALVEACDHARGTVTCPLIGGLQGN